MSLRVAQRGYRYQDFIAGRIVLDEMLKDGNPTIQVDEKDDKNDLVDDLKVIYLDKKTCYQIKYTTTSKSLSWVDIIKSGQLDLSKLYKHFLTEDQTIEYVFILKWQNPTNEDNLFQFLDVEKVNLLNLSGTTNYIFKTSKFNDLKINLSLVGEDDKLNTFLSSIKFICNAPDASLDIINPYSLENEMIGLSKQLGIGVFPNNNKTHNDFIIGLIDELTNKRSSKIYLTTINELLIKLGVVTNFGSIPQHFQLNEKIYIPQTKKVTEILNIFSSNNKIILTGIPGSGKSYFVNEFIEYLKSADLKHSKHYFFVGSEDIYADKRISKDTLIGNLLQKIYRYFPTINKKGNTKYGSTITELNNAISMIKEPFYLIIDGIDHAYREYYRSENQKELIDIISQIKTSDFVKALFVSQPIIELQEIQDGKVIQVSAWTKEEIIAFSDKFGLVLNQSEINDVQLKSCGN